MGDVIPPRHAPALDAVAGALMDAWQDAEGSPVTASYVATYVDLARAALDTVAGMLHDETPPAQALRDRLGMTLRRQRRCVGCGSVSPVDASPMCIMHPDGVPRQVVTDTWVESRRQTVPYDEPQLGEDDLARLRAWLNRQGRGRG